MRKWMVALLVPALLGCSLSAPAPGTQAGATSTSTEATSPGTTEALPTSPPTALAGVAATSTSQTTSLATGTPVPFPQDLQRVWMSDESSGWGADAANRLYRTADGGVSWYSVSVPGQYVAGLSAFLAPAHAWLADYDPHRTSGLWRTTDGGLTWTHLTDSGLPNTGGEPLYQFTSAEDGLVDLAGFGEGKMYDRLFETHDGGATFAVIPVVGPTSETGLTEGVVQYCRLCGNAFYYDPSRAILVSGGIDNPPGAVHVQQSTDRGEHWRESTLALPTGYQDALVVALPLVFRDEGHGYLPVRLLKYNANGKAYDAVAIYTTSDGGATWSPSPTVLQDAEAFMLNFNDLDVDTLCGGDLCVSHDGAQTWEALTPNVDFSYADTHYVQQMTFAKGLNGWIILWQSPAAYKVYRTVDGGSSWTLLNP